jgi:hypothetical protein
VSTSQQASKQEWEATYMDSGTAGVLGIAVRDLRGTAAVLSQHQYDTQSYDLTVFQLNRRLLAQAGLASG